MGLKAARQPRELPWALESGREAQRSGPVGWIRVAPLSGSESVLGLSGDGCWSLATASGIVEFSGEKDFPFFLRILEMTPEDVKARLRNGLVASGLSPNIEETFPCEDTVIIGLTSNSEHWVRKALGWMVALRPSEKLVQALSKASSTAPTQKLRHRALKLRSDIARRMGS